MTRLVVLFLLGVIVGGAGMKLQEDRVERAEMLAAARATPANTTKPSPEVAGVGMDRRDTDARGSADNVPTARTTPDTSASHPAPTPARTTNEPADPRDTVPVPEVIQPLMSSTYDGRTVAEMHEKLEREPKNDWSYQKEQELSDFFVPAHGSTRFDVHSIECRTTMCEVQAVALGPTQQNTVIEDLQREPWWDFARSFTRFGEHNGSTSVVLYLLRDS
jgi:hypothetical protein